MKVKYKRLMDNFYGDAPFMGCLLVVPSCKNDCEGCQNQHLKREDTFVSEVKDVGLAIEENPFWEGIILGGLEPLDDKRNFKALMKVVEVSKVKSLCIYTSYEIEDINMDLIPSNIKNLYIKTGKYDRTLSSKHIQYNGWILDLASNNQNFYYFDRKKSVL